MLKKYISFAFLILALISCQKNDAENPFLISSNKIGPLTHQTKVGQLDSIFKNDSVVTRSKNEKFLSSSNEIEIYEKGGEKLLILEASSSDPDATIKSIQVIDKRFQTPAGLTSNGYFKDIKDHYNISKINNTLSAAVIFVDSIQAYLTIDKKELPAEFKFNTSTPIKASNIPDSARIKNFWVSWDQN